MAGRLKALLVADPVESVAQQIADGCQRLAEERVVASAGERALILAASLKPEMCIISLELMRPDTYEVVGELRRLLPNTFIVVSFRELAVPTMERLGKLSVDDFVPQPIDYAAVFRAASRHFGVAFRRHDRHSVTLDVVRADGVLIGRTRDLSEGGLSMDAIHPMSPDESLLVDVGLPERPLRVRSQVLEVEGQAPAQVRARFMFEKLRGKEHERLVQYLASLGPLD